MEIDTLLLQMINPKDDEKIGVAACIQAFREGHFAIESDLKIDNPYMVSDSGHLYFRKTWCQETLLLNELKRLLSNQPETLKATIPQNLLEAQKKAIENCMRDSLSILIGGPGTGKTYTAGYFIKTMLEAKSHLTFALCAPTGKACSQLKQSIQNCCQNLPPHRVLTLHSLLETEKEIKTPWIPEDLVIVDEASMIDIDLFGELFSRIKKGGRLLLIGDPNQLPPVETAPIFPEIVDLFRQLNRLNNLQECKRVENLELIQVAEDILQGKMDFELKPLNQFSINHLTQSSRILTPLKVGPYGVASLNQAIFDQLLPKKKTLEIPIMITKNDFNLKLFNGEIGEMSLNRDHYHGSFRSTLDAVATFYIDGQKQTFPVYELPPFDLCYALSVHKSQGSAFDHPILLLPKGTAHFGRELLYTAFTRSKKGITVYGDADEVHLMLQKTSRRTSALTPRYLNIIS